MNREELVKYEEKLLKERDKIIGTIDNMNEHGLELSQREEIDELSMYDNHPADLGSEMFDKERRFALLNNEESILEQIDTALARVEDGSYGTCELCGDSISRQRLDFLPYVTTCIDCEEKKPDYTTYRYDRPVEEEVIPPFGSAFHDNTEDDEEEVEYNMEDSWQDVAKYEKRPGMIRNFDDIDYESLPHSDPEADAGIVEFTDKISNQQYKNQLP
jgi:YteA family regulatory protein